MDINQIFQTYAMSVIPIGWVYYGPIENIPIAQQRLLEAKHEGQFIYIFPCATAFLLSINENSSLFITANHAFPDPKDNNVNVCTIIPEYSKCPYEVTMDDLKPYLGIMNSVRLEEQDICVFEVDTPETLYMQHPIPLPISFDFKVGDEVCTIGYPFIGYEGTMTDGKRDIRFVERLTYAHLSAIWPNKGTLTLEFDNYVGPGNSGGPLINIRTGAVIGVVSWIRKENQRMTTFSHASCIIDIERTRDKFPGLPEIRINPPLIQ